MKHSKPEIIGVAVDELSAIVEAARSGALGEEQYTKLKAAIDTLAYLSDRVEHNRMSVKQLRELLFGKSTEKATSILPDLRRAMEDSAKASGAEDGGAAASPDATAGEEEKPKGHGRNGAEDLAGAERICVKHGTLKAGDVCPECKKGKVYLQKEPSRLIRFTGQAPLHARVFELERLRCALCGEVFTADAPQDAGPTKYDARAAAMIGLLKYGCGLPFHRMAKLQGGLEIPLPASTQWEVVERAARTLRSVVHELIRRAAQGAVLHNDDTTAKILALGAAEEEDAKAGEPSSNRKGAFTTGIVAEHEGQRIALYFTGRRHAGENLARVLRQRALGLPPPIHMCDALSRNLPKDYETILAHCLAHARRHFVKVVDAFPEETRHVVLLLGEVYKNDAIAKARGLVDADRLHFHQEHSTPVMEKLRAWLEERRDQKLVEPSSGLGMAIAYILKHWNELTLFLRVAGAPLDNNICERALKKAILHRKNALFFKTENGADVGDIYLTLIHTAELAHASPHAYLSAILENPAKVAEDPSRFLPWNYAATLESLASSPAS